MTEYQSGLHTDIKSFIAFAAFLGPIAIVFLITKLKKIGEENPERIRWK
tara:strand:+ start:3152 stop:3298 length:147 start_codon:yes stop_codon:yes gene_type:complete